MEKRVFKGLSGKNMVQLFVFEIVPCCLGEGRGGGVRGEEIKSCIAWDAFSDLMHEQHHLHKDSIRAVKNRRWESKSFFLCY